MNILSKIINRIRKKAYTKNPFNLKNIKKARELTPEEENWYKQNKNLIPQEITDVGQEIGIIEQPQPQEIEQQFPTEEAVDNRIKDSIHTYLINTFRGTGKWSKDRIQPSPDIYQAILEDESGIVNSIFTEEIKNITGNKDPRFSKDIFNTMVLKTKDFLGGEQKLETDVSNKEIEELGKRQVKKEQDIDISLADIFSKTPQYINLQKSLAGKYYQGDPNKAADHAKSLIERNLSSPTGKNKDQRMAFFIRNPEEIPDNAFNLIKPLLAQYGYNDINLKEDLKKYDLGMAKSVRAKELTHLINQGAGILLVDRLTDLINNNDKKIYNWVARSSGFSIEKPSLSTQVGEGEEETTLEDLGVGEKTRGISEDENRNYLEARKDHVNLMTEIFVSTYLNEVIKESQALAMDTHNNINRKAAEAKGNKKTKMEDIADRLLVFMSTATEQINPFFERTEGHKPKYINDPNKDYTTFIHPSSNWYKINIPKDALGSLFLNLEKDTGKKPWEHFVNGQLTAEADQIIRNYAMTNAANWSPDWNTWVRPEKLNKKLNDLGRIKMKIKNIDANPSIDSSLENIYKVLPGEDKNILQNVFKNDNVILGFIDRTKRQPLRGKNSLERDWLYAGQPEKGGVKEPKTQPRTEVKQMISNMEDLKNSGKYGEAAFKSFFNIIKPHGDIMTGGKEGKGIGFDNKSLTENIHHLMGTREEEMSMSLKLRNEVRKHNTEKALEKIKQDQSLSPASRALKTKELKDRWKKIEKSLSAHEENLGRGIGIKGLEKKQHQAEVEIRKINREARKRNGVDDQGNPLLDKSDNNKIKAIQNGMIDRRKEIAEIEKKMKKHKKKFPLDTFAINYSQFKMIYSMFLQDSDKIIKLANMMNKYNNIKMAANANNIENMIDDIICKYEKILNI